MTVHDLVLAAAAGGWDRTTPGERAAALDRVAAALDDATEELVPIAQRETHLWEARLRSELTRTTFQLRLLAGAARDGSHLDATIDHPDPDWLPLPRPDLRRVNVPLGPVVVFAAGNFPFAFSVAGGDTASALAAGCPVLLKAHPGHLDLSRATARVVEDALDHPGAFALVVGDEAGRDALTHPLVRAGAFTGALASGRALFDLAQSRPEPIPFYAEMGSVNPLVVTRAAIAQRKAEVLTGYAESFTMFQGQLCTKPGVLLVPRDLVTDQDLRDVMTGRTGGLPLLNDRTHAGYVRALEQVRGHATEVSSDERATDVDPSPTLLTTDTAAVLAHPELLHEVFGPASLVVRYDGDDDLAAVLAALPGQLTAGVHAVGDEPELPALLEALSARAGRVVLDGWPTGVAVTHAMHHGGPYPATSAPSHTSVGTASLARFVRPVCYQGVPDALLPPALQDANPLGLVRRVDGRLEAP